jgi:hypothetical protein
MYIPSNIFFKLHDGIGIKLTKYMQYRINTKVYGNLVFNINDDSLEIVKMFI